jgi:hypothetical protein
MSHSTAYWAGAFYGVAEGSMNLALHVLGTVPGLGILVHTLTDHKVSLGISSSLATVGSIPSYPSCTHS